MVKRKLSFNAPVVLSFLIICFAALVLGFLTNGATTNTFFSVYRSSLADPLTYVRFIGHVFGHTGWGHFLGNMTLLLLVGPMLEEKYGSDNLLIVMIAAALATGIVNYIFFPYSRLLGASGVVFALIMMTSFTSLEDGKIPLTFILLAIIYIGGQVYEGLFVQNNVANLAHIIGGIVGSGMGYFMAKNKMTRRYH